MIYRQKSKKTKIIKAASKTKTNMKNIIRGVLFCALWYLSIIAGFFLLVCPILPLAIISPKRYRKWSDIIFGMWEPFPVAIMEVCLGVRVVLTGDKINPFEGSLFVMNHRTRVDWNFLWLGLFHCCQPNAHNMKYILKAPIMHFPGPGWVMQTCSFIFVYRDWAKDEPLLDRMIDYLNESDSLYQILLFPEGTDLTEKSLRRSHKYADEKNLEKYNYVLHPRTTGFSFIASKMKTGGQLKAIYDVTVAYPKTMPLTETDLMCGKFPEEVHFNVKRYSSSNIPFRDADLRCWLADIWQEKEKKLRKFYTTGSFTNKHQTEDSLDRISDERVDFGKTSMKNGIIKYDLSEILPDSDIRSSEVPDGNQAEATESADFDKPGTSNVPMETTSFVEAEIPRIPRDHVSCEEVYKSEHYRPSHIMYLILVFWITLIIITIHQLFYNIYLQIWVLVHSLLFTAFSFVSNGFHHVAASYYFYRHKRKPLLKKSE